MKQIQKNITIIVWILSILFGIYSFLNGMDISRGLRINGVMAAACILSTIMYFIPISDRIKAIVVLSIIGISTLLASIFVGGNSATFLASFLVIGAAVLYFDPVILIGYSVIYLIASFIVYKIDAAYIVGSGMDSFLGIVIMFTYLIMSVCLALATFFGKKILSTSEKEEKEVNTAADLMQEQAKTVHEQSTALCEKMQFAKHSVTDLSEQVSIANTNVAQVKQSEDDTIEIFNGVMNSIKRSSASIEENYKLIDQLTENFTTALENVSESKCFSSNTQESMNNIQTTIARAYDNIVESSKETAKIKAITEDINSIASQTNLLAINASIEAARVGEAGKGFNIVADQVRNLSVQSKDASENIGKILSILSQSLEITKEKINRGQQAIGQGMAQLNHMIECIHTIDQYSNQSQVSLTQEVEVFEQTKKEFSVMAEEVEKAMKSAELSKDNLSVVTQAIDTQTNRTTQVANQLNEIEILANQLAG